MHSNDDVASPCMMVCKLHEATQICIGCLRTRDEIASWSRADTKFKLDVLEAVEERKLLGKSLFTKAG